MAGCHPLVWGYMDVPIRPTKGFDTFALSKVWQLAYTNHLESQ